MSLLPLLTGQPDPHPLSHPYRDWREPALIMRTET